MPVLTGAYIPAKNDNQQLFVSFFFPPAKQLGLCDTLIFRITVPVGACNDILSLNQQQYRELAFSHLCISHEPLKKSLLTFCSPSAFRSQIGYTRSRSHTSREAHPPVDLSCSPFLGVIVFPTVVHKCSLYPHTETHTCKHTAV